MNTMNIRAMGLFALAAAVPAPFFGEIGDQISDPIVVRGRVVGHALRPAAASQRVGVQPPIGPTPKREPNRNWLNKRKRRAERNLRLVESGGIGACKQLG